MTALKIYSNNSAEEASLIGNVASHIKEGYITAKGLRLASICSPGVRLRDLGVSVNIDMEQYITSYRLKNSLTNILKKKERQPTSVCKFEWADAIYAELQGSLMNDRRLSLWYDERKHLLSCRGHTDMYMCCSKRTLILALTHEIRSWLAANMSLLKST